MIAIATFYVEQSRHDTSRVVHYAGGNIKNAIRRAIELSFTTTKDCAWLIAGNKPIAKYFCGKKFKCSDTV